MTLAALALVLTSAVIHATWNLWVKQIAAPRAVTLIWLLTCISSIAYAPFVVAQLATNPWRPGPEAVGIMLASGVIHVAYFALLLRGYRVGDLSLVYPVARGTGPLLAAAGAMALLGERPTAGSVTGALLVVAGVLVLTWRPDPSARARLAPGIRYGLATGAFIALYTLVDTWGVKRAGVPPLVFYWGGEVVRVITLAHVPATDRAGLSVLWRDARWKVLGVALLSPLSYILILLALRTGDVGHIAPAREISILIGAFLGAHVLGEQAKRRRLVAAGLFVAGVVALALAGQ